MGKGLKGLQRFEKKEKRKKKLQFEQRKGPYNHIYRTFESYITF